MRRRILGVAAAAVLGAATVLTGCAAPADDGEVTALGAAAPPPARPSGTPALPVVVDTDLGADDLAALAFLLRHPAVEVRALTIATTGLVGGCEEGAAVLGGLVRELGVDPVPVACGRGAAGPSATPFPAEWRAAAEAGSGVTPLRGVVTPLPSAAHDLIAHLGREQDGLVLVALGPMTTPADVAREHPDAYARLAAVHAMGGSVAGPPVDGVAEWNAAADPEALAAVLAAAVPTTLVPEDAVPTGTSDTLRASVVGRVVEAAGLPAWWDLAAVAALVVPDAADAEVGGWTLAGSPPGRLAPRGTGHVTVVRSLDPALVEAEYRRVLGTS